MMFNSLIKEVDEDYFFKFIFEKKPFLDRSGSYFSNIFSLEEFDRYLISGEGFLQDLVRISRDGRSIVIPACRGQSITQREFVLDAFRSGATLKLEGLDNRHSEIAKICKNLEAIFGGYVFAKPFLTGANCSGLDVHFDTTEVFVIQLEGRKSWKVWDNLIENPTLPLQQSLNEDDLGLPALEAVLEPGDVLYIPAGTPHSARCLDGYSLHMAIGLQPLKFFEILEGYLRLMSENVVELRKNVYPFTDKNSIDKNSNIFIDLLKVTPFDLIKSEFDISYSAIKYESCDKRLSTLARLGDINENTVLRQRQGADIKLRTVDGLLAIYFSSTISPGKPLVAKPSSITLPDYCKKEIEDICSRGGRYLPLIIYMVI